MNYDNILCRRVADVPPSGIRKFFDVVSEMDGVISLGVGEPDFNTPWTYTDAAIYSLRRGHTHYTSNWGLIELRRAINRYLIGRFETEYDPTDEILVTVGASEGIDLALRALVEPGDEVIVPDPSYVSYMPNIRFAGGVCVAVPTVAEEGFRLTPERLRAAITPRTKALILPYPNNPTGAVLDRPLLERLRDVFVENDLIVISDEIYSELTYTEEGHTSIASLPGMHERTIVLNGFSKAFAMTGWRMGYLCAPAAFTDVMCKIHQYTILCAPRQGQVAAEEALRQGREDGYADVVSMRESYNQRRRLMVQSFRDMGLSCFEPLGAFYVFPGIQKTGLSSEDFCQRLLREKKVVTVPGTAFGASGEGYIRCSYATGIAKLTEALDRMADFVASL